MAKKRNSKSTRPPGPVRAILAQNFVALRDARLHHLGSETARNRHVAKTIGSSLSQVQRIATGESGPSIDELDRLATLFGTTPHEMITPYLFRLPISQLLDGAAAKPPDEYERPKQHRPGLAVHES